MVKSFPRKAMIMGGDERIHACWDGKRAPTKDIRYWNPRIVQSPIMPRARELPLTIPANVDPIATFAIQSVTFMAAIERLLKKRSEVNKTIMAMDPMTRGCRIEAWT